jgi:CubicO group peptidase (beta-lactamase class C family)
MKIRLLFLTLLFSFSLFAQTEYFPPQSGNEWATTDPDDLGWCTEQIPPLLEFLEDNNTKAFIVLKDGKIVIEAYFGDTEMTTNLPWNSAGKTITALMVGIAQENGLLDISEPTSAYLGTGWTSLAPEQEDSIKIWHQLTMTTGLDDTEGFCTDPECLQFEAEPGTRWAYHNAPYTLLADVVESASGFTMNNYVFQKLKLPTGIDGAFIPIGFNKIFFGSARGMARMGLLILNRGNWNGTAVLSDSLYLDQMTQTSQSINPAYGYLWWLNGTDSYMLPSTQLVFPGQISPAAPMDLIAGLGKNGQYLDVVPSQNLIVIRMGDAPNDDLVPTIFHNDMWSMLSPLICEATPASEIYSDQEITLYPNPANDQVYINAKEEIARIRVSGLGGHFYSLNPIPDIGNGKISILTNQLPAGLYILEITDVQGRRYLKKMIKN